MAFENVTLFEVSVDGTDFGALFGGDDEALVDETVEVVTDDESTVEMDAVDESGSDELDAKPGAGRKRRYVAVLGLAVVGGTLVRRFRRRRSADAAVDVDEPEGVAVEEAVAHENPVEQ